MTTHSGTGTQKHSRPSEMAFSEFHNKNKNCANLIHRSAKIHFNNKYTSTKTCVSFATRGFLSLSLYLNERTNDKCVVTSLGASYESSSNAYVFI